MDKQTEEIMKYEPLLPQDFDGMFWFTNWTKEDFVGMWGNKEYNFPAQTTSPIVMMNQTPLEVQSIRKKFAKDLAEREFGKGEEYLKLIAQERNNDGSPRLNSFQQAGSYSINSLAPLIQQCLIPLPVGEVKIKDAPKKNMEDSLSKNEEGEINTQVIDRKISLKKKALEG